MRLRFVPALLLSLGSAAPQLSAQDLAPRAYVITAVHSNAITITWAFYDGGLNFNGTIPVANASGTYYVSVFSYYHSLNFFGRIPESLSRLCCFILSYSIHSPCRRRHAIDHRKVGGVWLLMHNTVGS